MTDREVPGGGKRIIARRRSLVFDSLLILVDLPLLLWLLVMHRLWPQAWTAAFLFALGVAALHRAVGGLT